MSIFDKIWNELKTLFPFLTSAAEKTFNQLESTIQTDGINGSLFAQIIKENVAATEADVKALIKAKLNLTDEQLSGLLTTLGISYKTDNVITYLQDEFTSKTDDILHSSFATEVAYFASIILSNGKLTWLTLLMGVGEYIFRKFVKAQDVSVVSIMDDTNITDPLPPDPTHPPK